MKQAQQERYSRQLLLEKFGPEAQQQLLAAKVLVIGAGGLGCPALQYLVAAGVDEIGIADADSVSISNLQRQMLYTTEDVGLPKSTIAPRRLRQMNPDVQINEHPFYVDNHNALALFHQYDYVIDGTDNFTSRYLINDACVLSGKPLIFGAVYQYEGQAAVFNVPGIDNIKINYRHLFPVPPTLDEAPDCVTAGVLGVLPGLIGTIQATEVIKLITGIGRPLINQLLTWNMLTHESAVIDLSAAGGAPTAAPQTVTAYEGMSYDAFCNPVRPGIAMIDAATFREWLMDDDVVVIDVRETGELPLASFRHLHIPFSVFEAQADAVAADKVVLFCQTGARSLKAAAILASRPGHQTAIYNLQGGILSLQ